MDTGTTKLLRYAVIGGLFLIPISVLIVANSLFFPFITGKAFFYRIIVEIIFAIWLILAFANTEYRPVKQKIYYVLFALLALIFVSNLLGASPYKAFWSNFERMDGWIALIHHAMFFVVVSSMFNTYALWQKFWKISLGTSVIVCFYSLLQRFGVIEAIQGGGARVDGTFGNAAYLAVYNLFHIFLASWFLYKSRSKASRFLYAAVGVFNLLSLYWTATRGAFVGFVVGIVTALVILIIKGQEHKNIRKVAIGIMMAGVILIGAMFIMKDTAVIRENPTLARFSTISLSAGETRFTVWKMALRGFAEKPIIGWGQEGFTEVFAKYYEPSMYGQEPWFDRAHNIVIDWLIAGGIIGLALYLSLFVLGFKYIWKSEWFDITEKALFSGLYVGYFVQNLFVFDNIGSYILFFSTLAFIAVGARKDEDSWFPKTNASQSSLHLAQPVIAVLLVLSLYVVNIKPLRAGQEFITAYIENQSPENIVKAFENSLSQNTFADYEVTEQMMVQAPGFLRNQNVPNDLKQDYFSLLEDSIAEENERYAGNARFNYAVGVFYSNIGQFEKALEYLKKAHELSPLKQIISFELGFAYINNGDKETGMSLLKETVELAPDFAEARKIYALGAILTDNRELEEELLAFFPEGEIANEQRFVDVYVRKQRMDKVVSLLKERLASNPLNIQNYVSLAAAYVDMGERAEAINVLQQAIQAEPAFKERGEEFITDIKEGKL